MRAGNLFTLIFTLRAESECENSCSPQAPFVCALAEALSPGQPSPDRDLLRGGFLLLEAVRQDKVGRFPKLCRGSLRKNVQNRVTVRLNTLPRVSRPVSLTRAKHRSTVVYQGSKAVEV